MIANHEKMKSIISHLQKEPWFSLQSWNLLVEETTPDVALSMLEKYIDNLREASNQIHGITLSTDSTMILKVVHKLSSTSEILGLLEFSKKCRNLQKLIKENRLDDEAENLYTQIRHDMAHILTKTNF